MIPDPEGPAGHPARVVPSEACQPPGKGLPWTCWATTGWDSHQGQGRAVQKSPNVFCHCLQPRESFAANSQPKILPGSGHSVPASPEPRLSPEPFCCAVGQLWLPCSSPSCTVSTDKAASCASLGVTGEWCEQEGRWQTEGEARFCTGSRAGAAVPAFLPLSFFLELGNESSAPARAASVPARPHL